MSFSVIGTVGVPACYGGFETLVENLLDDNLPQVTVYCSSKAYDKRLATYKNAKLFYIPLNANGVTSIIYDIISIFHAVFICRSKKVLILGVSGTLVLPLIRLFSKCYIVTNVDGIEWRRDKWGSFAKWFLKLSESMAVKFSHEVISDNAGIASYIKDEYGTESNVIAYGGDHANVGKSSQIISNYALALCRIEPENNVHIILEAFAKVGLPLKFVGNWDNSEYGRELKRVYSAHDTIEIIDSIYDKHQLFKLRDECLYYLHGHSAGGTNPSLVEIMHFGKAVVAFDCLYNRATMKCSGIYFETVEELQKIISQIDSYDLDAIGREMKAIADSEYLWERIRSEYYELMRESI